MTKPDQTRGRQGIVCSLVEQADGSLKLVMDDVVEVADSGRTRWEKTVHFTSRDYDRAKFLDSGLGERDFADIGVSVVARLAALASRGD